MTPRILPALLGILSLSGWAAGPATATPATVGNSLTPQVLFQFMLAEIAGSRGETGLAVDAFVDLANKTRDARIARRATEVAMMSRRFDSALASARLWAELDPESAQARQAITGLLAMTQRTGELKVHLAAQLALAGPQIGAHLLQLNRVFARHPDRKAAQRIIDEVTEPYLGIAEAHFARAQAAHGAQDVATALSELDKGLALRPDWEQAALVRAQLTADPKEAVRFIAAFVAANPQARDARLVHARALVNDKRYAEARDEFRKLIADSNDSGDVIYAVAVLSLQLNEIDEAERHLLRLVDMDYNEINSVRLYLGQIGEERKKPADAAKWYGMVTGGDQYMPARMRLAHVLAKSERLEEARKALQETAATSPSQRGQLIIAEAQLLREAGRQAASYQVLETGLAAHPDMPDLLYESALAAEKVGKNDVLERNLRRLIELKPDHAHAHNALGYSLADRNDRLDEAQRLVDRALELAPDDPFILDSKGWVLFRRGDAAGAADVLRKALTLRPDPEIAAHLGEVLWSLGRQDEARKTWNDAVRANPTNEVLVGTMKKFAP